MGRNVQIAGTDCTVYNYFMNCLIQLAMAEKQTQLPITTFSSTNQRVLVVEHMEGYVKLLCAAKIMRPLLFNLCDPWPGTASYLCKFQEECHLLSLARHPVPDYLLWPWHPTACSQWNSHFIPWEITMFSSTSAWRYHYNGLIHRGLTRNIILKYHRFWKLATGNPRMTALLTLCPGNLLYNMSPELKLNPTDKLDIVIQIWTRQFPNPTDCFQTIRSCSWLRLRLLDWVMSDPLPVDPR